MQITRIQIEGRWFGQVLSTPRASLRNFDPHYPPLPHICVNCRQIRKKPRCRKHRGKEEEKHGLLLYYRKENHASK